MTREINITRRRTDGQPWGDGEIDSIYVEPTDRFVVSLIVSYDDAPQFDTPQQAASAALELTRDDGSGDTIWYVYDRDTGAMYQFEQSDFEGLEIP